MMYSFDAFFFLSGGRGGRGKGDEEDGRGWKGLETMIRSWFENTTYLSIQRSLGHGDFLEFDDSITVFEQT